MLEALTSRAETFEAITDACSYLLRKDPQAQTCRDYIDARLSRDLQIKYGVGYFPSSDNLSSLIKFVGKGCLERFNIIYPRYISSGKVIRGHFSDHNLLMPFRNVHGDIVSLMGRSILPDGEQKDKQIQKYKYSLNADKELYVYGLDVAKRAILEKGYVICVEGQFDCIACHRMGIYNVVALGWATLSRYQFYQLLKYTDSIILMFDNDEAGEKGKVKAKARYSELASIKGLSPPTGYKDIDEFDRKEPSNERKGKVINMMKNLM